jgi:prolycopene isomerase
MSRYDAVVIGAGLGGLAAAAKLARAGARVRLFERHNQPGGYATSFCRGRFEFEVSLHAMTGVRPPEKRTPNGPPLEDLGVADLVDFVPLPALYRSVGDGINVEVPAHREGAIDALMTAFPAERAGVRRVFDELFAIKTQVRALSQNAGPQPSPLQAIRRYPHLSHAAAVPLCNLLDRELKDPWAKLGVGQLWGYFGLGPRELSLLYFAIAVTSFLDGGAVYPKGKSQALSAAFVKVIRAAGGEVTLGDGVRRILVHNHRVTGVESDAGERVGAPVVISNANPWTTVFDMLSPHDVERRYAERLAAMTPSMSTVNVYLGLDQSAAELGLKDYEIFFNHTADMDVQYDQAKRLDPPESVLLTAYSLAVPDFSPKGTSVVTLSAAALGQAWREVPPARYASVKEAWATAMVDVVDRHYPGLRSHIEEIEVSTPLTNMRYTGNPDGAVYGFAMNPAQCPAFRLPQAGPVSGLWLAGAWTMPGGGFEPVIESGYTAALAALQSLTVAGKKSQAGGGT